MTEAAVEFLVNERQVSHVLHVLHAAGRRRCGLGRRAQRRSAHHRRAQLLRAQLLVAEAPL